MPSKDVIELLGGWEGYRIEFVERYEPDEENATPQVWIGLARKSDGGMVCSGCGQACKRYRDWDERWIRDLPILDAETHLLVQRFRVAVQRKVTLQA